MIQRIYFDTVAFRVIGQALEHQELSDDVKPRLLLSPITLFEVWSQLAFDSAKVLAPIQAVVKWTEERIGLLPWPVDVLFGIWHGALPKPDEFTKKMQEGFVLCLNATSSGQLRDAALDLRAAIDYAAVHTTQAFENLLNELRANAMGIDTCSDAWFNGIAKRAKGDPRSKTKTEIVNALSAYHEFEMSKLNLALKNPGYNVQKHKNDVLDAEQLVYLSDESLCFLTCDGGYTNLVKTSPQLSRIRVTSKADLSTSEKIERTLRQLLGLT